MPWVFQEGYQQKQELTLCQGVLDGDLPAVMPDLREHPEAMWRPAAKFPRIRCYVSVPVTLSDGTLYGTFCAAGLTTDKGLAERDKGLMDVLPGPPRWSSSPRCASRPAATRSRPGSTRSTRAGGPRVVLQPIVDIVTGAPGRRRGAEPVPAGVAEGPRRRASPRRTASAGATRWSCWPCSARPASWTGSAATCR